MSLTPEDTKIMKGLFDELRQQISIDTEGKINTAVANIKQNSISSSLFECTVRKLREEIQATEDNIKQMLPKFEIHVNEKFNTLDEKLNYNTSILQIDMNTQFKKIQNQFNEIIKNSEYWNKRIDKVIENHESLEERNSAYSHK